MKSMDICQVNGWAAGLLNDDIDRMISLAAYILKNKDVLQNV